MENNEAFYAVQQMLEEKKQKIGKYNKTVSYRNTLFMVSKHYRIIMR